VKSSWNPVLKGPEGKWLVHWLWFILKVIKLNFHWSTWFSFLFKQNMIALPVICKAMHFCQSYCSSLRKVLVYWADKLSLWNSLSVLKMLWVSWVVLDHNYNPSFLGGWDCRDHGLRPACANISWDSTLSQAILGYSGMFP
jgi:hypothetical protein